VQAIIDPQSHNRDIAATLLEASQERKSDPTLGGLLPDATTIPTGANGILETASKRFRAAS
jgi:hypothetical protein